MVRKLVCPYYMKDSKAFTSTNSDKSYFLIATVGSCQQIISTKGTKMAYLLVKSLSGEELYGVML